MILPGKTIRIFIYIKLIYMNEAEKSSYANFYKVINSLKRFVMSFTGVDSLFQECNCRK